jgi:hypothetical protein
MAACGLTTRPSWFHAGALDVQAHSAHPEVLVAGRCQAPALSDSPGTLARSAEIWRLTC